MEKILKNEDWLAFLAGMLVIITASAGYFFPAPKFTWTDLQGSAGFLTTPGSLKGLAATALIVFLAGLLTWFLKKHNFGTYAGSFALIFLFCIFSQWLSGNKAVKETGFEYVIFALLSGILIRSIFGLPAWIKDNLHTEFFIKTGLVILGASVIFGDIMRAGSLGLLQAVIVVLAVWFFAYWVAKKLKVDDEMALMLSSAVSICGVSAAIATAGAIKGDPKKLSYVVSLVLIVALPMLILMPIAAKYLGLNPAQAGAWVGGTIDTSGAVVASGTLLGDEALKFSTIVKFSQNVLIGFAAVAISVFWVFRNKKEKGSAGNVNFGLIWERFPKFVLGFIAASVIFSFLVDAGRVAETKDYLKSVQTAFFSFAFVGIGLETDLSVLLRTGNGKPASAFIIAQLFNILFTLLIAWFLFR